MRLQFKALREKNATPKKYKKWTDKDEAYLEYLKNETISIEETELGKAREKLEKQCKENVDTLRKEMGREALINYINATAATDLGVVDLNGTPSRLAEL